MSHETTDRARRHRATLVLAACVLLLTASPVIGQVATPSTGTAPIPEGPQSLSGSFVVLDPTDQCVVAAAAQTFCFRTETFTTDFEYADALYLEFPADWTVTDVSISGTPVCDSGTWGSFGWSTVSGNAYEIRIAHQRTMGSTDHCVATYCVKATSGSTGLASWYWEGDGWGATPHHPCSSDGYTPSDGSPTCDEAVEPPVNLDACDPGVYVTPAIVNIEGCAGSSTDAAFAVLNATGGDATFDLSYDVPSGLASLGGPADVFVANGATVDITTSLNTQVCLYPGTEVTGVVGVSGNGYSDTAGVVQTTTLSGGWSSIPSSSPGWAGLAYPVDGCTAIDGSGHAVTYVLGDTSGGSLAGLWGFDHTTETWGTVTATGTPTDRWAPDWAYDPDTNLCYLTGGASAPGGGDISEAYLFDPVAATFSALPSFATARDFHDSWVATVDGVRYLCIGGGVDVPGNALPTTQCYDLAAAPGNWQAENGILGGYPNGGSWGSADGVFRSPGADQLWVVAGIIGGSPTGQALYFDDVDNSWHTAPDVPIARYRVEGEFLDGDFYLIGGSSGGFTPTDTAYRATGIGSSPSWQELPPAPNARMDNIVAAGPAIGLRSVDGYGSSDGNYVDLLDRCTPCTEIGTLQGTIFDSVTGAATCQPASVEITPGNFLEATDASGGYGPLELIASSELGPYDVSAKAPGHSGLTATGTMVFTGTTTTQDFALTRPAMEIAPTSVETSVVTGGSTTESLDLSNIGHEPLEFHFVETPPTVSPLSAAVDSAAVPSGVAGAVWSAVLDTGSADYLVYFNDRPNLEPAISLNHHDRGQFVMTTLRNAALRSQESARRYLSGRGVEFRPFWIANVIAVTGSDRETMEGLLALPEVHAIRPSRVYRLYEPAKTTEPPIDIQAVEANLSHVGADQVWGMGFDGSGVVVANIDTGVRYTHQVLVGHYRGNLGGGAFDHDYDWLDPVSSSAVPLDDHGHGSHTMGTMVGDDGGANQTGIAPGAQWIACRGCSASGGCPAVELLTCAEWIAAPYPIGNPAAADPALRPNIVNNSWGDCDTAYDGWFQTVVDAWHAAGIYPVFSNGNASNCGYSTPPGCNTVGNPGRYGNVTSVGSTGQANGAYAPHSNWGPTDSLDTVNPAGLPAIKPQVVAPGVSIRSAVASADDAYSSWDGTSMSAPHVSGLIALMWQAAPCLVGDYAATETIIQDTATAIPYASSCGGEGPGDVPNQATGWGEINANAAVLGAIAHCDTDWLPWVSESPVSGVVPASSDAGINLNFVCTADGDNHGTVRVLSNDPCQGPVEMPLTLHCGPATASIVTVKETIPPATMQEFEFTGAVTGTVHDGHELTTSGQLPGTFTVTESVVAGWTVDSITCDDGDSTGHIGSATATYRLAIGETVTCTFVNRQDVGACGYPVDLVVGDHTADTTASWHACHGILATGGFQVSPTGVVTLRAGSVVMLDNGFSVQNGGSLTINIDPSLQ